MKVDCTLAALFLVPVCVSITAASEGENSTSIVVEDISIVNDNLPDPRHSSKPVQALAVDDYLKNHIVFARGSIVYTMNVDTNKIDRIAGNGSWGYVDGVGAEASFKEISAIITGPGDNRSTLFVCDLYLSCIRSVNRKTNKTSESIGKCSDEQQGIIPAPITSIARNLSSPYRYVINVDRSTNLYALKYVPNGVSEIEKFGTWSNRKSAIEDIHLNGQLVYVLESSSLWSFEIIGANVSAVDNVKKLASWKIASFQATNMLVLNEDLVVMTDRYDHGLLVMKSNHSYNITRSFSNELCLICSPATIIRHPTKRNTMLIGGIDLYAVTLSGEVFENQKTKDFEDNNFNKRRVLMFSLIGGILVAVVAVIAVAVVKKHATNDKIRSAVMTLTNWFRKQERGDEGKKDTSKTLENADEKGASCSKKVASLHGPRSKVSEKVASLEQKETAGFCELF